MKHYLIWLVIVALFLFLLVFSGVSEATAQEMIAEEIWSFGTGGTILCLETIPDMTGDGKADILVGSSDNVVYLLNEINGAKVWSYLTDGDVVSIATIGDITGDGKFDVALGSSDKLVVLNGATGVLVWNETCSGNLVSVVSLDDITGDNRKDIAVLGTNYIEAFDCFDANIAWLTSLEPPYRPVYSSRVRASITDDITGDGCRDIVAVATLTVPRSGSADGYYCEFRLIDAKSGEVYKSASTNVNYHYNRWIPRCLTVIPDVTGDGYSDIVFLAVDDDSLQGYTKLLNGANLEEVWNGPTPAYSAAYIKDVSRDLRPDIVISFEDSVALFNGASGSEMWRLQSIQVAPANFVAEVNETDIIVGTDYGIVYVDGVTGSHQWSFFIEARSTVVRTFMDDISHDGFPDIVFGCSNRFVYAINGHSKCKVSLTISLSKLIVSPGGSLSINGFIQPALSNITIAVIYVKPDGTNTTRNTRTELDGHYEDSIAPDRVGLWSVEASWKGDEDYLGVESETVQFLVEGNFLTLHAPRSGITVIVNGILHLTDMHGTVTVGAPKNSTLTIEVNSILEEGEHTRFIFLQWSDGDTTNPRTIILKSNMTLAIEYKRQYLVEFDISQHVSSLTFTVDEEQYLATSLPIQSWFNEDSTHTMKVPLQVVTDGTRCDFVQWSDLVTSPQRTISIQGLGQFVARFDISYELEVDTVPEGAGVVSGAGWYTAGSDAQITAQDVVTGSKGTRWIFENFQGRTEGELTITITMNSPTKVTALYETEFYLKIDTNPSGIVSVPAGGWHKSGTQLTLGPLASEVRVEQFEYTFQGWLVDDTGITDETILLMMERPHEVYAVYYKREVLEFPVGLESKQIHVITNSSIKSASRFEDRFSIVVEGNTGTKGILSISFPIELLQHYDSSPGRIMVLLDKEEVSPLLATKEDSVQVTIDYEHSIRTVDVYYNSFTLEVKVNSLFNLPVQGASVRVLWPDGTVFKTGTTDGSGTAVMNLPATTYTLKISSWLQSDTRQLLIESNQLLQARFIFYWDLLGILIAVPTSLGMVFYVRKRGLVKAGKIDPLVIKVAEKYKRPLSASLLTRELELSLEDSRKALLRFVKNRQGRVYKDIDGTEYIGIPSVWKDLPGVENTILNKLLELGRRAKRAELRAWLGLPEIAFSQVMNSLEKNGYVAFDRTSDEYGLKGVS